MARTHLRRRSISGRLIGWIIKAVFLFVLLSLLWVAAYRFINPPFTFTMAGDMLGGRSVTKSWMPIERIDRDMVRAVIAGEDSKFCSHSGFDTQAIEEAMRVNAKGGSVIRGGSTISQQTSKNVFLWQGGGYFRKGLEAWFTLLIENIWGKRRIMEVYLNVAETGIGTYGVNAAAQRYFGKGASGLTRSEAARIAAIFPLPKRRDAVAPTGFTRRYGNMIVARIGVVQRDGLDSCVYEGALPSGAEDRSEPKSAPKARRKAAPAPKAEPLPGEEYEVPLEAPSPPPPEPEPQPEPPA
jgi:monofunctional glycosyltransferase